jgi:peroxiredoxin
VPERLVEIKDRHNLSFIVASDVDNALARRLGGVFTASEASQQSLLASGSDLGEITGTGTWDLPMPTIVVVDRMKTVRFADVPPDWMVRTEADPIIAAVREVLAQPAAAAPAAAG